MPATYTKPTKVPRWADSGTIVEPSEGKKDDGWEFEEIPASSYENWKENLTGEWFKWINERIFDGTSNDQLLIKHPGDASTLMRSYTTGLEIPTGLLVGFSATPTADAIKVGDANFTFDYNTGNPQITYDSGDLLLFTRASNLWEWKIGSSTQMYLNSTGLGLGASPSVKFHISGADPRARLQNTDSGDTAFTHTMTGIELIAGTMDATNKLTPALKFGSTDASFTTTNPKFLAAIIGEAWETYGGDTDSGMDLVFYVTEANGGAAVIPKEGMRLRAESSSNWNLGIGVTPNFTLHVSDTSSSCDFFLSNGAGAQGIHMRVESDADTFINNINNFGGNGTTGNTRLIVTGQTGIDLKYGDSGTSGTLAARISGSVDAVSGVFVTGASPGTLIGSAGGWENWGDTTSLILAHDSNVAHGFTTGLGLPIATDVWFAVWQASGTNGGAEIAGATETTKGVGIHSLANTEDTTDTSGSTGGVVISASLRSGTGTTTLGATGNVLAVHNEATCVGIIKGDGDFLSATNTFGALDTEQDAVACQDLAYAMSGEFDKIMRYHASELERIGVLKNGFISLKKFQALTLGAVGELYGMVSYLLEKSGMDYETLRRQLRSGELKFIPQARA